MTDTKRFFFHSFPRRGGRGPADQVRRGELIAKSMLEDGLLLTPENYEIPLLGHDGSAVDSLNLTQRRICFTELEPQALPGHAEVFGPFSLVYEIDDLRRLGALPVFYVPFPNSNGHLSRLAAELLSGLADMHRIVSSLEAVQAQLATSASFNLKYRDQNIKFGAEQSAAIREFLDILSDSASAKYDEVTGKITTLASCFYPTENPRYNEPLHYYRQREWRILAGTYSYEGEPFSKPATQEQIEKLLRIDDSFFSKRLKFYDSSLGIGALIEDTIAGRSHYFRRLGDLDAIATARALIVPDRTSLDKATIEAFRVRGVAVVRQGDFSKSSYSFGAR